MAYVLSSAPKAATLVAAALLASSVAIAGPAQVTPVGSIQLQPSSIVDSPAWRAKQQARLASQRLATQRLTCVAGVITHPEYL